MSNGQATDQEREGIRALYREAFREFEERVHATVFLVSPDQARRWLARNTTNRPLGRATVERYARYIRRGMWRLNGEPIILTKEEELLDGQHRLEGIVEADISIPLLVVLGIPKDAFKTLDQGRLRTGGDTLSTLGEHKAKVLASSLGWLNRYESGCLGSTKIPALSNEELVKLLSEFPEIRQSVDYVAPLCQRRLHPPGPFSFLHFVCLRQHPEHKSFFDQVLTGAELAKGSPAFVLRRRLESFKTAGGPNRSGSLPLELVAVVIKAWNAIVQDRTIAVLKWDQKENFPEIL